jgi:type VI secretion system secreted protein Hcp
MSSSILLLTITAALLLALVTIDNAEAAVFAKYDGIDGEATDSKHDKWIDILSVDFKAKKPGAGATGESRRRGAAIIDDFVLTMEYDKASPKLMEKLLKGEVIPKLEIEFTATFGGARETYLKWELINVQVTDYSFSGSGSDEIGPPVVVVGNNFEEIKVTYTEFDEAGNAKGNVEAEFKVGKGE